MTAFPFGSNVSIDTRTINEGDAFFALKGESLDGHNYVEKAFQKGAGCAVVRRDYVVPHSLTDKKIFFVEDTLKALWEHAQDHLQQMPTKIVALTGSSGKTTTKEMIRDVLSSCLSPDDVFASVGNFNNHVGVPLSILKVKPQHKVAVFELGMNHFGEIEQLTKLVRPDVGLIINIGTAHAGNLGGVDGVAKAKSELFENLKGAATALVNVDDPRCVDAAEKTKGPKLTYGVGQNAEIRLVDREEVAGGMRLTFSYKSQQVAGLLPTKGAHNAQNATAAISVACALGLDLNKAVAGLASFQPVKGRFLQRNLKSGAILIDDTYNANPDSMRASLGVLKNYDPKFRKIAVLGEMGELGSDASQMHYSIGASIVDNDVDLFFCCGSENALKYEEGAITRGFDPSRIVRAKNSEELATKISEIGVLNDIVFVKGSRSAKMEIIVDKILSQDLAGR